jgi:hypothetical protein
VLPNDLGGPIAFDAFRARVPGCNEPMLIKRVDGVFGDGIDQKLKTMSV